MNINNRRMMTISRINKGSIQRLNPGMFFTAQKMKTNFPYFGPRGVGPFVAPGGFYCNKF